MHRPVRIMYKKPATMTNTILCKFMKNVSKFEGGRQLKTNLKIVSRLKNHKRMSETSYNDKRTQGKTQELIFPSPTIK